MADLIGRGEWGARRTRGETMLATPPLGVKVHYLAGHVDPGIVNDHARCAELVRDVQAHHMDGNGWNDVGYSGLVCPHRGVFVGRGPGVLVAANGAGLNAPHYAVACLLGERGLTHPTDAMLDGLADAIRWLRRKGDAGGEIAGHRDGYATECPGDPLYKVVKRWRREGLPPAGGRPTSGGLVPPFVRVLKYPPVMYGEDVRMWQAQMRRRGWALDVDGAFGPRSREVAADFAGRNGFNKANGRVTRPVWEAAWTLPIA